MAFCSNCGQQLDDKAKFCSACGTSIPVQQTANENKRRTVYEGEIRKCPNCGEVIDAFAIKCIACGHEFRNSRASESVVELARKLEEIEDQRDNKSGILGIIKEVGLGSSVSSTDEKKISLIRSFPIPNTKEDLLEFMILASSNVTVENDFNHSATPSQKAIADAWESKFLQAYEKAKISFVNQPEFTKIEDLYKSTISRKKKASKKTFFTLFGSFGLLIVIFIVLFIIIGIGSANENKEIKSENQRLSQIVEEVYEAIGDGDYITARSKAATIIYNSSTSTTIDDEAKEKWDSVRAEAYAAIEAAENSVMLGKPTDNADEEKTATSNSFTDEKATNPPKKPTVNTGAFDAASIVKQLKVTEHCRDEYGHYFPVLIIENPTDYNLSLSVDINFYDKTGKLVGAKNDEVYAFEKGTKTIMLFSIDEKFDRMEYEITVEEEDYYNCVISSLKYENVSAKDKEILSVTNTGKLTAEFVEGYALFFKNGNLIGVDWEYFTDDDSKLKPDETITKEMNSYGEEYDTVEFYFTGRAEKE